MPPQAYGPWSAPVMDLSPVFEEYGNALLLFAEKTAAKFLAMPIVKVGLISNQIATRIFLGSPAGHGEEAAIFQQQQREAQARETERALRRVPRLRMQDTDP